MAFFAGLAEGFITGRKMKAEKEETDRLADYRKTEQEYRADRDTIGDTRYIEEREAARKREAILDDRYETQLSTQRLEALIKAGLSPDGQPGTPGGGKGNSPEAMEVSKIALSSRVEEAELDEDSQKYFATILGDAGAAHTVYSFLQSEAVKNNNISLNDIPTLIRIAGATKGQNEEAMALLRSNFGEIKDQKDFVNQLDIVMNHIPSSLVLDIDPAAYRDPNDIKVIRDQRDLFVDTSIPAAQAMLASLPDGDPTRNELSRALANVGSGDAVIKSRAVSTLMKYVVTPELIANLEARGGAFKDLSKNEFLLPYMPEPEAAVKETGGEVQASGLTLSPEPIASAKPAVLDDLPSFDSWREASAWHGQGNSGQILVNGNPYLIKPSKEPVQTEAPVVDESIAAPEEVSSDVGGLANLAKEQGIRSQSELNKFIFKNVEPVPGDRKATNRLQRQMFEELSAILGL
jgi:hypothetical protein